MTTIKFVNVHLPQAQAGIFSQVCFGEGQRTRRLETSNYWFAPANMKMLDCVRFIAAFTVQIMKLMIIHHFTSGLGSSESWCWVQAIVTECAEAHLSWPTLPLCRLPPNLPPLSPPHMAFLIISEHYLSSGCFILWGAHLYLGGEHSTGWALASVQLYQSQCWTFVRCT